MRTAWLKAWTWRLDCSWRGGEEISHAGVWRWSSLLNSIAGQDGFCFVKQLYKNYAYMVPAASMWLLVVSFAVCSCP